MANQDAHEMGCRVWTLPQNRVGQNNHNGPRSTQQFESKYATHDILLQGETPVPFRPTRRQVPEYFTQLTNPSNPMNRAPCKAVTNFQEMKEDNNRAGMRTTNRDAPDSPKQRQQEPLGYRQNPISWEGAPQEEHKVTEAFRPSKELQRANDRSQVWNRVHQSGPNHLGPNAHHPDMLAWSEQPAGMDHETLRFEGWRHAGGNQGNKAGVSQSNRSDQNLLAWNECRDPTIQADPFHCSRGTRQGAARAKEYDMDSSQARNVLAFEQSGAARAQAPGTRDIANRAQFSKVCEAMTSNKANSDTYSQLFKARDRNSEGRCFGGDFTLRNDQGRPF